MRFELCQQLASRQLSVHETKGIIAMSKSIDAITEIIRNPKHSFRKAEDRPVKAQKHRYTRRKIREYLKQSDWAEDDSA